MKSLAGFRCVFCAAFCLIGGLILPQSASAIPITDTTALRLDFGAFSSSPAFDQIQIGFDYGADPFGAGDSFSLQLYNGSGGALGSAINMDGGSSTPNTSDKITVSSLGGISNLLSPFYAILSGTGGSFDFELATAYAYSGSNPDAVQSVVDAATVPIPASLPLFLTGGGLVYGLARRRRRRNRGQISQQAAA